MSWYNLTMEDFLFICLSLDGRRRTWGGGEVERVVLTIRTCELKKPPSPRRRVEEKYR